MTPIFTGRIITTGYGTSINPDCDIYYDDRNKFHKYIQSLSGQRVEVIIRKPKTKRSDLQNNFYWGVVIELLSKELGYDQEELHEILKYKFLKKNSALNGMEYVKSTAKLTTGEFEEYLDKIKRWSAEFLNIVIPNPNEAE